MYVFRSARLAVDGSFTHFHFPGEKVIVFCKKKKKEKKKKHKSLNYPARGALQQIWMEKAETLLPRSIAEKYSPASLPA